MGDPDRVDPVTPQEWQSAVDAAEASLLLDAARTYGAVTGGPEVDVQRGEQLLVEGAERGFTPTVDAIERFLAAFNSAVK